MRSGAQMKGTDCFGALGANAFTNNTPHASQRCAPGGLLFQPPDKRIGPLPPIKPVMAPTARGGYHPVHALRLAHYFTGWAWESSSFFCWLPWELPK